MFFLIFFVKYSDSHWWMYVALLLYVFFNWFWPVITSWISLDYRHDGCHKWSRRCSPLCGTWSQLHYCGALALFHVFAYFVLLCRTLIFVLWFGTSLISLRKRYPELAFVPKKCTVLWLEVPMTVYIETHWLSTMDLCVT